MSVPATGDITLTGINTVFGKVTTFSLNSYAGTTVYDVTTGASTTLGATSVGSMRTAFVNTTPLGKVAKPTITVAENASVASGTLTNCVTISWSTPGGATPSGYTAQVSTDGTTFTALTTPTSTSTTHTPTSNTRYWYRIRATTAGANGAWSTASGAAVFPNQTTTPTFTPPTTSTYITFTGAAGGVASGSSDLYRAFGIRFANLQGLSTLPTYTMSFGTAGGQKNAGGGFASINVGGFYYTGGGAGGYGYNTNCGGGGGASIIVSGYGYLVVGGGGGQGDKGWAGFAGGAGGASLSSSAGTDGVGDGSSIGGTGAGHGGTAGGGGGGGGSGANANGYSGTSGGLHALSLSVGSGGEGVSDGNYGGGGGGGGWGGGGGGAAAANNPGWSGRYFAGGGGGGSTVLSATSPFASVTASGTAATYVCGGWAYAVW